jgi:hypothetical protein
MYCDGLYNFFLNSTRWDTSLTIPNVKHKYTPNYKATKKPHEYKLSTEDPPLKHIECSEDPQV